MEAPTVPPTTAPTSPPPEVNSKPVLGVVKASKSKVPAMPPTPVNTIPPPAFGAAPPPPATTPGGPAPKARERKKPSSGLGPDRLPEPYRSLCPAELRGEPMMEWYFAVQTGERLVLERAQTMEGISAQLTDQGEMLGDVIRLIESLGRGMAQVIDTVKRFNQIAPIAPANLVPTMEQAAFAVVAAPRRAAPPPPSSTAADAPYEPPPPPAVDPMQVMLSRTPMPARLTNKDAAAIREFAHSLVPIPGIPWAADQQIAVASEVAEECLSLWAGPGKTAPSRWPEFIRAALIDRFGIDKARGD